MNFAFRQKFTRADKKILSDMGKRIKDARIRRCLAATKLAEQCGIDRYTLSKVESGNDGVSIGVYYAVLKALGFTKDIESIANKDPLASPDETLGNRVPWGSSHKSDQSG